MKRKTGPPAAEEDLDTYQIFKSASAYALEKSLGLVQSTWILHQKVVLVDKELATLRARNQSMEVSTSEVEKKAFEADKKAVEAEKRAAEAEKRAAEAEKRATEAESKRELSEVEKELTKARKEIERLGKREKQAVLSGENQVVLTYRQCVVEARDRGESVEHYTDKIETCDLYLIDRGLPIPTDTKVSVKDSLSST